jgi:hypothetical protein
MTYLLQNVRGSKLTPDDVVSGMQGLARMFSDRNQMAMAAIDAKPANYWKSVAASGPMLIHGQDKVQKQLCDQAINRKRKRDMKEAEEAEDDDDTTEDDTTPDQKVKNKKKKKKKKKLPVQEDDDVD